jgi:hypothetical protein
MRPALSSRLGPGGAAVLEHRRVPTHARYRNPRQVGHRNAAVGPCRRVIAAAALLGQSSNRHAAVEESRRNLLRTTGVTTRTSAVGET